MLLVESFAGIIRAIGRIITTYDDVELEGFSVSSVRLYDSLRRGEQAQIRRSFLLRLVLRLVPLCLALAFRHGRHMDDPPFH